MSLIDELKSASTAGYAEVLSESKMLNERDTIRTRIPALNITLSGDMLGGLSSGLTFIAGPSRHFKSNIGLVLVAAYLKKYEDAVCIFIDTEFGITKGYLKSMGVDPSRVLHVKCENIEQMKFEMANQLKSLRDKKKKRQKFHVMFFIDSVGNAASLKEVEDAEKEKSAADMTRAKQLKSLFRIVTPFFTTLDIPCVAINHTYQCGTKEMTVTTPDGAVSIATVNKGDIVLTEAGWEEVQYTTSHEGAYVTDILLENGETLSFTEGHRFKVNGEWKYVCDLKVGMEIDLY